MPHLKIFFICKLILTWGKHVKKNGCIYVCVCVCIHILHIYQLSNIPDSLCCTPETHCKSNKNDFQKFQNILRWRLGNSRELL